MAFFSSGVTEAVYSALAMNTPWCAMIICLSRSALAGWPARASRSAS